MNKGEDGKDELGGGKKTDGAARIGQSIWTMDKDDKRGDKGGGKKLAGAVGPESPIQSIGIDGPDESLGGIIGPIDSHNVMSHSSSPRDAQTQSRMSDKNLMDVQ